MRLAQYVGFFFLLTTTTASGLWAQGEQTEAAVNFEKRFIEAKQQALLGNTEKAITLLEAMSTEAPEKEVLFFELGRLHYSREQYPEAIAALKKAYARQPLASYAGLLGELYNATGQYKEGAQLYAERIKQEPDRADCYLQQANFLVKNLEVDAAIKVYDALEKRQGIHPEISRLKHSLYLAKGDNKRAEKELTALLEVFPRVMEFRYLLAGFYESQGNKSAAKATYQDILRLAPYEVKAQLALAETPQGRLNQESQRDLLTIFSQADVSIDLKIGKILPLLQEVAATKDQQKADEGLRLAQELTRVHPDEAKAWTVMGDLFFHSQRYGEAAETYQKTIALDDTVYPVWEQLLQALYLHNQAKDLSNWAEKALDIYPNRPFIYFYAALGAVGQSDFNEAASLMSQANFIFSTANAEATKMSQTYLAIIEALAADKIPPSSEALLAGEPLQVFLLATTQLQAGQAEAALQQLLEHDQASNSNALQLELLGDIYRALDQKSEAQNAYQRARQAGSKNPQLNQKIAQTKS